MGFLDAIKSYYIRYFDFETRSSRSEYWWVQLYFVLLVIGFIILIAILAGIFGSFDSDVSGAPTSSVENFFGSVLIIALILFVLGHIIPNIAITVRRFHDQDLSGWFYLFSLIPYLGGLVIFVFMLLRGTDGDNRFGPDPLGYSVYDTFT